MLELLTSPTHSTEQHAFTPPYPRSYPLTSFRNLSRLAIKPSSSRRRQYSFPATLPCRRILVTEARSPSQGSSLDGSRLPPLSSARMAAASTLDKGSPRADILLPIVKHATSFNAWSTGPRSCPGRKFSQLGFVVVVPHLFRERNLKPVAGMGEDDAMARSRVQRLVENESGLAQMVHFEKAVLAWENPEG